MDDRRIHIWIISVILTGPLITLVARLLDGFHFTFYLFPITVNSLFVPFDNDTSKELIIAGLIVPLFVFKSLIIGGIVWRKVYMNQSEGNLLIRFYLLVLVICAFELVGLFIRISDANGGLTHGMRFVIIVVWIFILSSIVRKQRITMEVRSGDPK